MQVGTTHREQGPVLRLAGDALRLGQELIEPGQWFGTAAIRDHLLVEHVTEIGTIDGAPLDLIELLCRRVNELLHRTPLDFAAGGAAGKLPNIGKLKIPFALPGRVLNFAGRP